MQHRGGSQACPPLRKRIAKDRAVLVLMLMTERMPRLAPAFGEPILL